MNLPASVEKKFTRPDNTTAYADGELVGNSATAADVVALKFPVNTEKGIMIRRARLRKSGVDPTNASFRLHLWNTKPKVPTNGDNGALAVSNLPAYLGYFDFVLATVWADGVVGFAVPAVGSDIVTQCDGAIYGLLEAKAAYTPVALEVFGVQLEILKD